MKKHFTTVLMTLFVVAAYLFSMSANAATIYVKPPSAGSGVWPGQVTYADIAGAIAAASANDEIWIAGGTYEIATGIIVDKNLSLYGGFSGTETAVDQRAKVGGGEEWEFTNSTEIKAAAGVKLITISAAVSLDGLTLNGDTKAGTQGVYVAGGSGTITRCIVKNNINNSADANLGDGAGISAKSGNKLTISFCWVDNNECTAGNKVGCGIRIYGDDSSVSNCLISNNKGVKNGGGIGVENQTGVVISNCRIIGNSTTTNGGAIFYYKNAVIYNCLIEGNSANSGGGIYLRSYASSTQNIYNNVIVNNTATSSGGGIILHAGTGNHSSTTIYNNIVAGNMPNGINFGGTSNGTFVNNILYDNKTGSGGTVANVVSSKSPSFKNNILDSDNISNLTQTACIIETDPAKLFTDYASGNYAPPADGFAGLDKGDASGLSFDNDLDYTGSARIQGSAIEIGPYELVPSSFVALEFLKLDGVVIDGFLQSKTSYSVALNSSYTDYPAIEAKAQSASASISSFVYNPVSFDKDGVNVVSFTVTDGGNSTDYSISFTVDIMPELSSLIISRIRADKLTRDKTELEAKIDAFLPYYVDTDGSFSDCHYVSTGRGDAEVLYHLERLREMAIAYTQPGNKYYEDETTYNRIVKGLQFWYSKNWTDNNWYYNRVSHPHRLGELLIAMYGGKKDIRQESIFNMLIARWRSNMGDPRDTDATASGANKCNIAMHWTYRACLTNDENELAIASDRSYSVADFTTGEGLQHDWAYRQHGAQLYIGGYGYEFIQLITRQAAYLAGTKYALAGDKLDLLSQFVKNTYLRVIRGQRMSFSTLGRGVTRQNNTRQTSLITVLEMLKSVDTANLSEYEAALKRLRMEEPASYMLSPEQTHYYRGEYTLQVRPEYTFDVRMVSKRMVRSEYDIRENNKGFFLSDGATNILVDGEEYGTILPLWDWKRIPGVTMPYLDQLRRADSYIYSGRSSYAGGVTDGLYGVTAFEMINDQALFAYNDDDGWSGTPNNNGTRLPVLDFGAKKSWFIFDKEIVCLGAGIYSGHDEPVNTTVNQCRQTGNAIVSMNNSTQTITKGVFSYSNVDWVLNDKVAYFFPEKPTVNVMNETKTASWGDINTNYSGTVSDDLFTLWLDHGVKPIGGKYSYIIVPDVADVSTAQAYSPSDIEILSNNEVVQAVYNKRLKMYGFAFFQQGMFKNADIEVNADNGCVILIKDADQAAVNVSVSDPQKLSTPINIGIKTGLLGEMKAVGYVPAASPHTGNSQHFTLTSASAAQSAQDVLLDRTDWTIIASSQGPVDSSVAPEGDKPEYMIDGSTTTAFLFVKPGKSYGGVTVASDAEPSFTIDMKSPQAMDYMVYRHRDYDNTGANLRASKGSFYGRNSETEEFVPILEDFAIATNVTEVRIDLPQEVSYRYVKFVFKGWDASSGNTMQVSEFNLGKKVNAGDVEVYEVEVVAGEGYTKLSRTYGQVYAGNTFTATFTLDNDYTDPVATGGAVISGNTVTLSNVTGNTTIHLSATKSSSGLDNRQSGKVFSVYPNPVKAGQPFSIRLDEASAGASVRVYTLSGVKVQECKATSGLIELNISQKGLYLIEVDTESGMSVAKVAVN